MLAYCRHCTPENASARAEWLRGLVQNLFHEQGWRRTRYGPSKRSEWPNSRTSRGNTGQRPQDDLRAARERVGGSGRPPNTLNAATAADAASAGPVTCPECGGSSGSDPQTGERKRCGTCRARRIWAGARFVSTDPNSPTRRWAALRNLWRPNNPFPRSLRWVAWRDGEGSLVACFAPLRDWLGGTPDPAAVQLIHIAPNGRPRRDRGGLSKRSRGPMGGSVMVMGDPLAGAGRIHVVEGVADALAVAAREEGAVIATGGTSGFSRLASDLARLRIPVTIWPDGDLAGRRAAQRLARALRVRGVVVSVARVPEGLDPAEMGGPFTTGDR